ncbi:hypothetical protein GW17_00054314 [Ensete ventricosum]|nr:hypothetical protein GW17_00054314 [Ensete ventricosum]
MWRRDASMRPPWGPPDYPSDNHASVNCARPHRCIDCEIAAELTDGVQLCIRRARASCRLPPSLVTCTCERAHVATACLSQERKARERFARGYPTERKCTSASLIISTASHFVLSYTPTYRAYDVMVQLSLASASSLPYLYLSTFVSHYDLHRFLFSAR